MVTVVAAEMRRIENDTSIGLLTTAAGGRAPVPPPWPQTNGITSIRFPGKALTVDQIEAVMRVMTTYDDPDWDRQGKLIAALDALAARIGESTAPAGRLDALIQVVTMAANYDLGRQLFPALDWAAAGVATVDPDAAALGSLTDRVDGLQTALTNEAQTRYVADTALALADVQELSARASADTALAARITTAEARLAAVEARSLTGQPADPYVVVAQVLVNKPMSMSFTWPTAWPDTNYVPELIGPSKLTSPVFVKTRTGCTVSGTTSALVTIGAVFNLIAYRVG